MVPRRQELEHLGVGEHSAAWAETLKNVTSLWHQLSLACFLKDAQGSLRMDEDALGIQVPSQKDQKVLGPS